MDKDSLYNATNTSVSVLRDLNLNDFFFKYGARINPSLVKDLYSAPIMLAIGEGSQAQLQPLQWQYSPLAKSNSSHPIAKNLELITKDELREIRRIWLVEKHEIEDILPDIYEKSLGAEYEDSANEGKSFFDTENSELLKEACSDDPLLYETTRNLISIELQSKTNSERQGIRKKIDRMISQNFFENEQDARAWKLKNITIKDNSPSDLLSALDESPSK